MFDVRVRRLLGPPLDALARSVDRPGITPDRITGLGLVLGLSSAAAAAGAAWALALPLWWASRLCDGLDGPLARRRRAQPGAARSQAGGFFDIVADFLVYGATVVGVGWGAGQVEGQLWLPFAAVLLAYYVNGAALLAFSSIAERTGRRLDDGRSLSFLGGIAEGTETILVHSLWLMLPFWSGGIAAAWAIVVALSAGQRIVVGYRALQ